MTEPTTLSTAQKLQAHAARILGKPSSKVEAQLLARIAKLSDQLLEIEAESRDIGDLKRDTVSLTGAERRALAAPLVTGETFPPVLKDHAAIATAIGILIRFVPELVEARRTYLTGQQDAVAAQAVPIRAELVQLRDQLAAVQKELAAS